MKIVALLALLGIIPLPRSVSTPPGTYRAPARMTIAAQSPDARNVAGFATTFLKKNGIDAAVVAGQTAQLRLELNAHDPALGDEGYRLSVSTDGIVIRANAGAGLYYGLMTLEQMWPLDGRNAVPDASIDDAPSYSYRGVMLDSGRHFFPVSFVKKYIDLASRYKMNIFHWHLTEDQGWRIEIKRYPKLTSVASCREGTMIGHDFDSDDHVRYCGYYTQAQIRDVVAYAKKRYVTIVPEIEMPGHSSEVLAAYPELACKPGTYAVDTKWGVSENIVCPSEATIGFYENVLREVMQLFPGPYIHTGGDEAPKTVWDKSPLVKSIEQKYHLANSNEVQGWFDRRIEAFLIAHGKRMIGWDEILAGNVTKTAIVESWRGISGGIVAATRGNDVIMAPDGPLYLDAAQGDATYEPLNIGGHSTLRDVYDFDPGIDDLPPAQQKHVLGAEAPLWTEYVAEPAKAEYMIMPRLMAVAELAWTPVDDKDYDNFVTRTSNQYPRLDAAGWQYRIPDPIGLKNTSTTADHVAVALSSPIADATMYYTTDGSMPSTNATRYAGPFNLALAPGQVVTVRVTTVLRDGRVSAPASATYERAAPSPTVP